MKKLKTFAFFAFLLIFSFWLWKFFSKSVWDGKSRLNLVLTNEKVSLLSLNPADKELVFLSMPSQTLLEVIRGFGVYKVESVFSLGEMENHRGGELLMGTVQENLGIPVDAYASISNLKSQISNVKTYILACFKLLLRNGKTNLTKWDLLRLWWELRKIRQDKIVMVDLKESLKEIVLPDGTSAFEIEPEKIKKISGDFLKDFRIRQENLSIAVLNSTNHSGLANRGARLVENIGGRVVEVGDAGGGFLGMEKCEIRSPKKLKTSYTVKKLIKIFACQWSGEKMGESRAQVVLILGEDYWKKLKEKW